MKVIQKTISMIMSPFAIVSLALIASVSFCEELRIGGIDFVEVEGTSRLPMQFLLNGQDREKTEPVELPKYWIAREEVSETLFAEVMGRSIRNGRKPEDPAGHIGWCAAFEFTEKFNAKFADQLPKGYRLELPTMIEWAHAVDVLKGTNSLAGRFGTMLFTGNANGGFLCSAGRDWHDGLRGSGSFDLGIDLTQVPKRYADPPAGIRPVLSPVAGLDFGQSRMVTRGVVLCQHGIWDSAKCYLEIAKKEGALSEKDRERADDCLAYLDGTHSKEMEDWPSLVSLVAEYAESKGYDTAPYANGWIWNGCRTSENKEIADAYGKVGIRGEFCRIGDLPKSVAAEQHVGDSVSVSALVGDDLRSGDFPITTNTLVQLLRCDFSGDGREDMVVECFGAVGSAGCWYSFYEQLPGGSYTNVYTDQFVGLCVFPHKFGKGCAFVGVGALVNPILVVSLLTIQNGELVMDDRFATHFYMLDAASERVFGPVPFIGAGFVGYLHREATGVWWRPLYWPWIPGVVQYREDLLKQVEETDAKTSKEEAAHSESFSGLDDLLK